MCIMCPIVQIQFNIIYMTEIVYHMILYNMKLLKHYRLSRTISVFKKNTLMVPIPMTLFISLWFFLNKKELQMGFHILYFLSLSLSFQHHDEFLLFWIFLCINSRHHHLCDLNKKIKTIFNIIIISYYFKRLEDH
jgi:hypothetical protein